MLALVVSMPLAARAHGVVHEVEERSGGTFAVRALYAGGKPLAGATYQVASPGSPERIHASGRTDRLGWLEFVPDAPGTWRVRIADATGHGKLVEVEVAAVRVGVEAVAASATPMVRAEEGVPLPLPPAAPASQPSRPALRTLAAALAFLLAFAALGAAHRRRRAAGR